MDLIIRSARIVDPSSPFHKSTQDVFIKNGQIARIGKRLNPRGRYKEIAVRNCHVSPGWFDMFASIYDPGFEYKEDLQSGLRAAIAGGFTGLALTPNSYPVRDSKSGIEYVINHTAGQPVSVAPMGAVSHNLEGKEITEMYDMHNAGASAFTDGDQPVDDDGLMMRSLMYVKLFDGVVLNRPAKMSLAANGMVNEGEVSIRMGMAGIPAVAEELMVIRDIDLAAYTDSRVHLTKVSTTRSVQLIREAKRKGVKVTASVSAYHLLLDDSHLLDFDPNYKVQPSYHFQ